MRDVSPNAIDSKRGRSCQAPGVETIHEHA